MLNSQHSSALPPNSPECRSTQAGPGLGGGTGDRSRGTRRDRGRLGQLGDGGFHSVADDVAPASRVIFEDTPEEIHQVGCVHSGPVLLARAEHDQVAGVVPGRAEKQPGDPAAACGAAQNCVRAHTFAQVRAFWGRCP